ncbi:hypothetical protein DNTS_021063 [Danionella cerebrum]|uniref:Uncharacterized protein n=1 Tax=Danionella cerebrum TaxID=2873325 RepID=A0A553MWR3_9TELE|nr:hypothetical protein DNTS_021063 [Danionella translucida]
MEETALKTFQRPLKYSPKTPPVDDRDLHLHLCWASSLRPHMLQVCGAPPVVFLLHDYLTQRQAAALFPLRALEEQYLCRAGAGTVIQWHRLLLSSPLWALDRAYAWAAVPGTDHIPAPCVGPGRAGSVQSRSRDCGSVAQAAASFSLGGSCGAWSMLFGTGRRTASLVDPWDRACGTEPLSKK